MLRIEVAYLREGFFFFGLLGLGGLVLVEWGEWVLPNGLFLCKLNGSWGRIVEKDPIEVDHFYFILITCHIGLYFFLPSL